MLHFSHAESIFINTRAPHTGHHIRDHNQARCIKILAFGLSLSVSSGAISIEGQCVDRTLTKKPKSALKYSSSQTLEIIESAL
jgi:hypothetical protein